MEEMSDFDFRIWFCFWDDRLTCHNQTDEGQPCEMVAYQFKETERDKGRLQGKRFYCRRKPLNSITTDIGKCVVCMIIYAMMIALPRGF
jgi:hypothetical protein